MPMMSGTGGAAMWIFLLLLVAAVGVAVFAVASTLVRSSGQQAGAAPPSARPAERSQPEETLRMRYARGEIDTDEFERRLAALQTARQARDPDL